MGIRKIDKIPHPFFISIDLFDDYHCFILESEIATRDYPP